MGFHRVCRGECGSTSTEQMLIYSVLMIALLGASDGLIKGISSGLIALASDVFTVLVGEPGDDGIGGGGSGGGGPMGGGDFPGGGGSPWGGGGGDAPPGDDPGGGDPSGDDGDDGAGGGEDDGGGSGSGEADDEADLECPYVYDEASNRWRDPETGQYVSGEDAAAAGC